MQTAFIWRKGMVSTVLATLPPIAMSFFLQWRFVEDPLGSVR